MERVDKRRQAAEQVHLAAKHCRSHFATIAQGYAHRWQAACERDATVAHHSKNETTSPLELDGVCRLSSDAGGQMLCYDGGGHDGRQHWEHVFGLGVAVYIAGLVVYLRYAQGRPIFGGAEASTCKGPH